MDNTNTSKILISEADYDKAIIKAAEEVKKDESLKGASGFIILMSGTSFANHMKKFLFENQESEKESDA